MNNQDIQKYYIRRRAELQNIDNKDNSIKGKTIFILNKDAKESIVDSMYDDYSVNKKKDIITRDEFLESRGENIDKL